jgi:hypothetical protein
MPTAPEPKLVEMLKDSALLVTASSVVLFVWGFAFESFCLIDKGVPMDLAPRRSLQEYLLTGGFVGLFFYAPVAGVLYALNRLILKRITNKQVKSVAPSSYAMTASIIWTLALSVCLLVPISEYVVNSTSLDRVAQISPVADAKWTSSYAGWYAVVISEDALVLVDHPGAANAVTVVLQRDQVLELKLVTDRNWRRKKAAEAAVSQKRRSS